MDISDGLFCDTDKLLDHNRLGFIELIKIDDEVGRSGEELWDVNWHLAEEQ